MPSPGQRHWGPGEPRAGPAAAPARSGSGLQPPASSRAAAKCCTARSDLSRPRLHTTAAFGRSPPTAGLQAFQTPLTKGAFHYNWLVSAAGGPGVGGLWCPQWGWRGEKLTPGQRNGSAVLERAAPTAEGQDRDRRLPSPHPTNTRALRRALCSRGYSFQPPSQTAVAFICPASPQRVFKVICRKNQQPQSRGSSCVLHQFSPFPPLVTAKQGPQVSQVRAGQTAAVQSLPCSLQGSLSQYRYHTSTAPAPPCPETCGHLVPFVLSTNHSWKG